MATYLQLSTIVCVHIRMFMFAINVILPCKLRVFVFFFLSCVRIHAHAKQEQSHRVKASRLSLIGLGLTIHPNKSTFHSFRGSLRQFSSKRNYPRSHIVRRFYRPNISKSSWKKNCISSTFGFVFRTTFRNWSLVFILKQQKLEIESACACTIKQIRTSFRWMIVVSIYFYMTFMSNGHLAQRRKTENKAKGHHLNFYFFFFHIPSDG